MMMRIKLPGRAGTTNVNMQKEQQQPQQKTAWGEKRRKELAEAAARNPNRITPRPDIRVKKRPSLVDLEQIPMPQSPNDLFDMLPTMTLAKQATLERMRMNKIMTLEDEYYLNQESREFDQEVRKDMDDAFGDPDMRERQERGEALAGQLPDINDNDFMPAGDFDQMPARRRRGGIDPNLI